VAHLWCSFGVCLKILKKYTTCPIQGLDPKTPLENHKQTGLKTKNMHITCRPITKEKEKKKISGNIKTYAHAWRACTATIDRRLRSGSH
jgi:hypothetical protein